MCVCCSGVEQQKLVLSMEQTCGHHVKQEKEEEEASCLAQCPLQVVMKKEQAQETHKLEEEEVEEEAREQVAMKLETPSPVEALRDESEALALLTPPITGDAIISLDLSTGWRDHSTHAIMHTCKQKNTRTHTLALSLSFLLLSLS